MEIQMDEVLDDVAQNEGDISLLFTGQIIQDERLVDLEDDTSGLEQSVESQYALKAVDVYRKHVFVSAMFFGQSKRIISEKIESDSI